MRQISSRRIGSILITTVIVLTAVLVQGFHFPDQKAQAQGLSYQADINKSFNPTSISAGGISRLSVVIFNPNAFELTLSSTPPAWTDTLDPRLSFANPPNITTNCEGTVTTIGNTLALIGGKVPPKVNTTNGSCTVSVDVTSTSSGNIPNSIPADILKATNPDGSIEISNPSPASVDLLVNSVQPPSLSKTFSPNTMWVGRTSVMAITIRNNDANTALSQVSLTDNLPSQVVVANPANSSTTCNGAVNGVVDALPGATSVSLTNGTVPLLGSCTVRVTVTSANAGVYTNLIPANAIHTQQGVTNTSAASAPLNVQSIGMTKSFAPGNFQVGGTSTLTITLQNPTNGDYHNAAFTDTFPTGLLIANPTNASTTCGGVLTANPGSGFVQLSGGTIPLGNPGGCEVKVDVTSLTSASYTNRIPVGALTTTEGASNVVAAIANLTVYGNGLGLGVSKSFSSSPIPVNGRSQLSISITAPADKKLTLFSLTDALPAGVVVDAVPSASTTGCSGGAGDPTPTFNPLPGDSLLSFNNGTIAAGSTCTLRVYVTSGAPGVYVNTISSANISNAENRNISGNASATLTVSGVTVSKSFSPATVNPGGISTLSITLSNNNPHQLDSVSFSDQLPITDASNGIFVASIPTLTTTCGQVDIISVATHPTTGANTIIMSGGMIPAQVGTVPGVCTVNIDVVGIGSAKTYTNTISTGNVSGTIHNTSTVITNPSPANATLQVLPIRIDIVKGFDPVSVFGGSASTLTIHLSNPNSVPLTGIQFTDNFPLDPLGSGRGMKVATPANASVGTCGGTLMANPGATSFTFSGGYLAANTSCQLTLMVTMNVNSNLTNVIHAGDVTTSNGAVNLQDVSATLTNQPGASISKIFGPNPIDAGAGNVSTMTITIQNLSNFPLTGLGLVDTLPVGMAFASPPEALQCNGGTVTVSGNDLTLTGGSLDDLSSCDIVALVTAPVPGAFENCIPVGALENDLSAKNASAACDTLTVLPVPEGPIFSKAFSPQSIPTGSTSGLTFTLTNPVGNSDPLTGVGFTDTFPNGMTIASVPNATQCNGGTVSYTSDSVTLSGGTLPVNGSCQVTVSVTAAVGGEYSNTSGPVNWVFNGTVHTGSTASDTLTVVAPPLISKAFSPDAIFSGGETTLTFTISNPLENTVALTGVQFADSLPVGLKVAALPQPSTSGCDFSSTSDFNPQADDTSLSFSSGSIAVGGTCTTQVNVTASGGVYENTTAAVRSSNGGTGNTASATLTVSGGGLLLEKSTTTTGFRQIGDSIHYDYLLTNIGTLTLYGSGGSGEFLVSDDKAAVSCPLVTTSLAPAPAPGSSVVCSADYLVQGGDVTVRSVKNTATAAALDAPTAGNTIISNPDSVTVRLEALTIKKRTTTAGFRNLNDPIYYAYTLTNTGDVTLYGDGPSGEFMVLDDHIGTLPGGTAFACNATTTSLAPGANVTCAGSRTYLVQAADISAASVTNTVVATARDQAAGGSTVTSNIDQVTVYLVSPPIITKAFAEPKVIPVGGVSILTISIENPVSNVVPLTGVGFVDNLPAGLTVAAEPDQYQCGGVVTSTASQITLTGGTILPQDTCTVIARVTSGSAGSYANTTGVVTSTNGGGGLVSNTDTLVVIAPPVISKAFSPTTILPGENSTITFIITNPNASATLNGAAFTDDLPSGVQIADLPNASLSGCGALSGVTFTPGVPPYTSLSFNNGSITPGVPCIISLDVTATTPGTKLNTTGLVTSTEGGNGSTSNTAVLNVNNPHLMLDKSIQSGNPYVDVGGTIIYSYLLTNDGNVTLIGNGIGGRFTITDDQIGSPKGTAFNCPATPAGLDPGATLTCTAPYTVTQADIDFGSITNHATGHGVYGATAVDTNEDSTIATATQIDSLTLVKSIVSGDPYDEVGEIVNYKYLLTNSGNVTLNGTDTDGSFKVSDDKLGLINCPNTPISLGQGGFIECFASSAAITQNDLDDGSVTNTAIGEARWVSHDKLLTSESIAIAHATQNKILTLEKTITSGGVYNQVGAIIFYHYSLKNDGNVTLLGSSSPDGYFTISDDRINNGTRFTCGTATSLAPGGVESVSCAASYTVTQTDINNGSVVNHATGHGLFGGTDVPSNQGSQTATFAPVWNGSIAKNIVTTELDTVGNNHTQAVIGEIVTYRLVVTIPEGTTVNAKVVDTFNSGLAFVGLDSLSASNLDSDGENNAGDDGLNFTNMTFDAGGQCTNCTAGTAAGTSNPLVENNGGKLTFDFGRIINTNTDATPETITIVYRAVVLNVAGNQNGSLLNNTAVLSWTGGSSPVSTANVTVVEPAITVAKSASPASGVDAGDALDYTITLTPSITTAYDVAFSDPLPSYYANPTIDSVTGAALADFEIVGCPAACILQTTASADLDLAPAAPITIVVKGSLPYTLPPSTHLSNTAAATWTSLNGTVLPRSGYNTASLERTGADGVGGLNDYAGSANVEVITDPLVLVKSLIATSEPGTSGAGLTIGEIARFRLVVRIPEGTLDVLQLVDPLPAGLLFLNDGTAKAALIAQTISGINSDTLIDAGFKISGDETTLDTITPVYVLPGSAISGGSGAGGSFQDGDIVTFSLGTVTNLNNDSNAEFLVIEFNALVLNESSNQAFNNLTGTVSSTSLGSAFSARTSAGVQGTSNTVAVQVAEPVVRNLTKTITTMPSNAGDTVVYRLTFSNSAAGAYASPAYDLHLLDTLPGFVTCQSVNVSTQPAEAVLSGAVCGSGNLDIVFSQVNPGSSAVVDITARVVDTIQPGQVINNLANLTYTSLPGTRTCVNDTGSCTPGASAQLNGERTGGDGSGNLNDYVSSSAAPAITSAAPTMVKTVDASIHTIGEVVVYRLLVRLPEGEIKALSVTDNLPAGMQYESYTVIQTGAPLVNTFAGTLTNSPAVTGGVSSGQAVTFTFGDSDVTVDNDPDTDQFILEVRARLTNENVNQLGVQPSNSAVLNYTNPNTGSPASVSAGPVIFTITEPLLSITKVVTSPLTPPDAGDTVTYRITVSNANTANVSTAYDLVVTDSLPVELTPGTVTVTPSAGTSILWSGSDLSVTIDALAKNASVTIDVSGTIKSSTQPGQRFDNQAAATWTSLSGSVAGERTGSGTPAENDYRTNSGVVTVTVDTPAIVKSVDAATHTIGELVAYDLLVTLPEGEIKALAVTDNLPAGLQYESYSMIKTGAPLVSAFAGTLADSPVVTGGAAIGQAVTFTFGDSAVNADNDPTTDQFVLRILARVMNTSDNLRGVQPSNSAVLNYTNPNTGNQASVNANSVTFTVTEPLLSITKDVLSPLTPPDAGDDVTYRITITNSSAVNVSTAYDLEVTDSLPLTFNPGVVTVTPAAGSANVWSGNDLTVTIGALASGSSLTIDVTGTLKQSTPPSQSIVNTAAVTWTSVNGASINERNGSLTPAINNYSVSDSASITTSAPTIVKSLASSSEGTTSDPNLTIGEVATYQLVVNLGEGTTSSLQVIDTLPDGMTYVNGSVTIDRTGTTGTVPAPSVSVAADQRTVTIDFGEITIDTNNLTNDNAFTIRLQGQVSDVPGNRGNNPGQSILSNSATLQANSGPVVTSNSVNVTVVEPVMGITKTMSPSSLRPNDTVTITFVVTNSGTSDAFDVVVSDDLSDTYFTDIAEGSTPSGFTFSATPGSGLTTVTYSGGTIARTNGSATFTFTARILGSVANNTQIQNTATVSQASTLPGAASGERTEPEVSDSDSVNVYTPDLAISKSNGTTTVEPGRVYTYAVTVSMANLVPASGVVITETVPPHTTFAAASSSAGWSCPDGSVNPAVCTLSVGVVDVGSPQTFNFAVRIDNPLDGVAQIANTTTVADDGTHGSDPNLANNTTTDTDNLVLASVGDWAWVDMNADGVQDPGETGLDGVSVTLTWAGLDNDLNTAGDNVTYPSILTSGGGVYGFTGLPSGIFQVAFIAPAAANAYQFSPLGAESMPDPATGQTAAFSLAQGEDKTDVDAGFYQDTSIGDRVWLDSNANGIQDAGETGFAGVTVDLYSSLGTLQATTTTDSNGIYSFNDLTPGDYTVQFNLPSGYLISPINQGSDSTLDSDADRVTGRTGTITLISNKSDLTWDMGIYQTVSLGDLVWNDINFNGIQDQGETGVSGVTVRLFNGLGVLQNTTTTDTNGGYGFTDLTPGSYYAIFTLPGGYVFSPKGAGSDPALDSNTDPVSGQTETVTLASGETDPTIDAGMYVEIDSLMIIKTANPTTYASVGAVIGYSYLVTNDGNVTLFGPFSVDDDKAADESCPAGDLAAGASLTCTASYTITQADLDAGSVTNIASATNGTITSPSDTATVTAVQNPVLTVVKSSTTLTVTAAGQVVPYSYLVTNTGNVTVTGIGVTDNHVDAAPSCPGTTLAPTGQMTCTAQYTLTLADINAGGLLTNVVTVNSTNAPTVTDTKSIPIAQDPALTIAKTATPTTYSVVGAVIDYSYLVSNAGNVTLYGPFTVEDDRSTDESCPAGDLAPGESLTCTASYTITQADLDAGLVTNVATATNGMVTSPSDTETVTAVQNPALEIEKTANPTTYNAVGMAISYRYNLLNTGNVTLSAPFTVDDDKVLVTCPASPAVIAPNEAITCSAVYLATQADLDFGSVTNTASGHAWFGSTPVDSAEVSQTVTAVQISGLSLAKSILSGNPYSQVGDVILYSYVVTNSGNVTLTGAGVNGEFTVTDDLVAVTCPLAPTSLASHETITCTASYLVTESDLLGTVTNHAVAHALYGGNLIDSNEAVQTASGTHLTASKLAVDVDNDGVVVPGDVLEYTIVVTNTGQADADQVIFRDTPDANTTLIVGSVTTSQGAVTVGNTAGNGAVEINLGTLTGPNGSATITFQVRIVSSLPAGVDSVSNQGEFTGANFPPVLTDNHLNPHNPGDPTVTPIDGAPSLTATKSYRLAIDPDQTIIPSPGDTLEYTILITNNGNAAESDVVFNDTPDANTSLVAGSVITTQGAVAVGNVAGNTSVSVNIGILPGDGAQVRVTFQVTINNPFPANVATILNQGKILGQATSIVTDDPATSESSDPTLTPVIRPTAVNLLYFTAVPLPNLQVLVRWETASEIDNYGFLIKRAALDDYSQAVEVTFVPSAVQTGTGSGAVYSYIDLLPQDGNWFYWLVDVDTEGRQSIHAKVVAQKTTLRPNIYIPMVIR